MHKRLLFGLLTAALTLLGGCAAPYSALPIAKNFPTIEQEKAQSAAHWNLIASDVATNLKPVVGNNAVYVPASANESQFARAFRDQLITSLVKNGVAVHKSAASSQLTLDVDTQLVKFSSDRYQNRAFGKATLLVAGLWALHGLDLYPQTAWIVGTAGAAALIDWNSWFGQEFAGGPAPNYELIVTASLSDSTRFVGRSTDVYYISDVDSSLYRSATSMYTIRVRGGD